MAASIFTSKAQRIIFIIAVVVATLVLITVLFINSFLKPILTNKLKDTVAQASDSLYGINFSNAELHVFRGDAVLKDIVLKPDTAVYKRLVNLGKAPGNLYELRVKRLAITGAGMLKLFFNKELEVGQIALTNPQVYVNKHLVKKDSQPKDKRTLYQKISKSFKFIRVNKINFDDVLFTYINYTGKKTVASTLKHLDLRATDLLIDSASQSDTSRTLFCKDITATLNNFLGQSASGLYKYKVRAVTLSTRTSRLTAGGIALQPLPTSVFLKKSRDDRFELKLDTLVLNNFDYQNYQQQGSIRAADMLIKKGAFEVFSNPNGPLQTTDRLVTFPHWAVRQLKMDLKIDTLRIQDLNVIYKEYSKQSKKTGSVVFKHIDSRLLNITNNKTALIKNNISTAVITSKFMGVGKLDLRFSFNLNDAGYKYSYRGHLGAMDMQAANPAVMPLGMVQIQSGKVKSLDFDVQSTQKTSLGKLTFIYSNLKVALLRQDDDKGYTKKSLLSTFANAMVLKSDNPDDGDKSPRSAALKFIRPANFPFFKTVWFTLLNGIKSSAMGKAHEKNADSKERRDEKEKVDKQALKDKKKEDKNFKKSLKRTKPVNKLLQR